MGGLLNVAVIFSVTCVLMVFCGPFEWMKPDAFDVVMAKMMSVNSENCRSKPASALYLDQYTVTQLPKYNRLLTYTIYPNRTNLLLLHNLALQRAFFYSLINYKTLLEWQWHLQPGLMYHYMSALADVSANNGFVNQSAFYYDYKTSFANWYSQTGLPLNHTLNLFGPMAWRMEDYQDPSNWLREPTNYTFHVTDAGAGPESDYSKKNYKLNEFYDLFSLPDDNIAGAGDSIRKSSYVAAIKYSNVTGKFVFDEYNMTNFFGPPSPGIDEVKYLPVLFTKPYFDCGKSNKWIMSAVAPAMDYLARYHKWSHIRRPRFVGVLAESIDFLRIDFNPCPIGDGNPGPSVLENIARCKETTICEPHAHWGFQRGGYQCVCKPGYRYPEFQNGPFQGIDMERSTYDEYSQGFNCIPVGLRYVIPQQQSGDASGSRIVTNVGRKKRSANYLKARFFDSLSKFLSTEKTSSRLLKRHAEKTVKKKSRLVSRHPELLKRSIEKKPARLVARHKHLSRKKRSIAFDQRNYERMLSIFEVKENVKASNCRYKPQDELELPGDVVYGSNEQFKYQAQTAVRLANFISNFLQNVNPREQQGNIQADQYLHFDQLFVEVISNVMGDPHMMGSGVFFDQDKFVRRQWDISRRFFGPYAWRLSTDRFRYNSVDMAGHPDSYLEKQWFKNIKMRWIANTFGLRRVVMRPWVRTGINGTSIKKNNRFPFFYRAAEYHHGEWTPPYFDCDGYIKDWVVTYSIPFFGYNSLRNGLEFKGVVKVDLPLTNLDINQCPADFYVPNAFKNTARCHYETTYCVAVPGKNFDRGGYKCECKQGYEYPFKDAGWFFDGDTMENEYRKKVSETESSQSRFDTLKCRIAVASSVKSNVLVVTFMAVVFYLTN